MKFRSSRAAVRAVALLASAAAPHAAYADDDQRDILVTAQKPPLPTEKTPGSSASVTAAQIADTVNAVNVEDAIKYLPSLLVRKRHIGDTQAPLATRTSGLGVERAQPDLCRRRAALGADRQQQHHRASPRWSLVSPQEIARIDVLYGPFSAAYPGNSIGAVVNITTRLPDELEATASAGTSVQTFDQYGTHATRFRPIRSARRSATASGRWRCSPATTMSTAAASRSAYVTATCRRARAGARRQRRLRRRSTAPAQPIRVLGASGIEHQRQDQLKLKAALDLTRGAPPDLCRRAVPQRHRCGAETLSATTRPACRYAGSLNIDGRPIPSPPAPFRAGSIATDERHWSHALSPTGTGSGVRLAGDRHALRLRARRAAHRRRPRCPPRSAAARGRSRGSTAPAGRRSTPRRCGASTTPATHMLSFGAHGTSSAGQQPLRDRPTGSRGERGRAQPAVARADPHRRGVGAGRVDASPPAVTLTVGGRYEWWRAYDGVNFSLSPADCRSIQPARVGATLLAQGVARLGAGPGWKLRSCRSARRGASRPSASSTRSSRRPSPPSPNPNLRPERARSDELALERSDAHGIDPAVAVQRDRVRRADLADRPAQRRPTLATFVQNVDRTRARGVELAVVAHRSAPARRPVGQRHLCRRDDARRRRASRPRSASCSPHGAALEGDARRDLAPGRRRRADRGGALCQPALRRRSTTAMWSATPIRASTNIWSSTCARNSGRARTTRSGSASTTSTTTDTSCSTPSRSAPSMPT